MTLIKSISQSKQRSAASGSFSHSYKYVQSVLPRVHQMQTQAPGTSSAARASSFLPSDAGSSAQHFRSVHSRIRHFAHCMCTHPEIPLTTPESHLIKMSPTSESLHVLIMSPSFCHLYVSIMYIKMIFRIFFRYFFALEAFFGASSFSKSPLPRLPCALIFPVR
jgi:hypothetical protein